jgi:KTSC domain
MATELRPVISSNIDAIGYNGEARILTIRFLRKPGKAAALYRYFDVPASKYEEFMRAKSKGSYFRDEILNKYRTERISG